MTTAKFGPKEMIDFKISWGFSSCRNQFGFKLIVVPVILLCKSTLLNISLYGYMSSLFQVVDMTILI